MYSEEQMREMVKTPFRLAWREAFAKYGTEILEGAPEDIVEMTRMDVVFATRMIEFEDKGPGWAHNGIMKSKTDDSVMGRAVQDYRMAYAAKNVNQEWM